MKTNKTVYLCFVFAFVLLFSSFLSISHAACWQVGSNDPYSTSMANYQDCKSTADGQSAYGLVCGGIKYDCQCSSSPPGCANPPGCVFCHLVQCDESCAGASGGTECPNGNADCDPNSDAPICCDGVCQESCGSNPEPNCKYLNVSSGQTNGFDDSGRLILTVGQPYSLKAKYSNAGKAASASTYTMNVLPGYSGSDCNASDLVFNQAVSGQPSGSYTFSGFSAPSPGIYTVYCKSSVSGYDACSGYKQCKKAGDLVCQGPGKYLVVNVVAPLPCPTGFNVSCAPSGTQATISWNALSGAVGYDLRVNKEPYNDWYNSSAGDISIEPVSPSQTINISPGANYQYDVQGKAPGENYPYAGARCPFAIFNCPAGNPPTCSSITGSPATLYYGLPPSSSDSTTLTAIASDSSGIKSYSWYSTPASGTFSSTTTNPTSWTPNSNTAASYSMNVLVTNNLLATSTCPAFTVNVKPTFVVTVNTKLKPDTSAGNCGAGNVLPSASAIVTDIDSLLIGSGITDASGTITFSGIKRNKDLNVCASYAPSGARCTNYAVDPKCAGPGCVRISPPLLGDSGATFEFTQSTGAGWVTAIDGDVEAGTLGNKVACTTYSGELNPPNGFKSYLLNFSDDGAGVTNPKAYAFSNSNGSTISTNNILEDTTRGGWAFNIGGSYNYLNKLTYKAPGSWFTSVTTSLNVSGFGLYKMNASDFKNLPLSATNPYTLSCNGCRAGILYVESAASVNEVLISSSFTTLGAPLLIVTNLPVRIANTVGISSAAGGTYPFQIFMTPNINAAIITPGNITVDNDPSGEKVIMLKGPLVSANQILFKRDVGLQNAKTPAEAVKYDPIFLCEASKLEKAHSEVKSYTGLGIFSVQWDYSE